VTGPAVGAHAAHVGPMVGGGLLPQPGKVLHRVRLPLLRTHTRRYDRPSIGLPLPGPGARTRIERASPGT
jgi:hypothetical protein